MSDYFGRTQSPADRVTGSGGGAIPVVLFAAALILFSALLCGTLFPPDGSWYIKPTRDERTLPRDRRPAFVPAVQSQGQDYGRLKSNYASQSLAFEPNVGQTDPRAKYVRARPRILAFSGRMRPTSLFRLPLGGRKSSYRPAGKRLAWPAENLIGLVQFSGNIMPSRPSRWTCRDQTRSREIVAENQLPGVTNYFLGRDPNRWHSGVAHYGQVRYHDIYPALIWPITAARLVRTYLNSIFW